MNKEYRVSLGALIAVAVFALCVVLLVLGHPLAATLVFGLIAALAVARVT